MKDPAFLFYTNDFDSGTKFLSNEQLGIYVRLLMAQHQHGRLTEKQVVFISGRFDDDIMLKFKKDERGLFYNERLEIEVQKRKAFAESRRNNVKKRYSTNVETSVATSVDTSVPLMENTNKDEITVSPNGFMANSEHLSLPITEIQINSSIEYIGITKYKRVNAEFIVKLWEVFKVKEFTGKKWYNNTGAVFTHFLNSLKYEKIEDVKASAPVKHNDTKANNILKLTD